MALELNQTCYKNAGVCQTLHKITQPKLDSGLYLRKNILFRPSSFSLFNKGLWNKNKRKQKQQRTDSPFSIKGAAHLMILMHINNHAKHITVELVKQICHRLLVSPCFPDLVIHGATPTGIRLQLLRELSRSVCQILPGAPRHDLWALGWIGYLQYWKCAMPVCSRGALQQLTVLARKRENHGTHICCFPNFFPHVFQFFSRCLRFPMFFTFSPAFHPFFHRCSPTFWNSPFQARRSRGETSPAQRWFHGCVSGYTTRSRECCVVRKDPKGSERPEICDVAQSESLDMIGHLRCEWIRFRLFDMNGHSEWIWYHWK